ncbi:SusC/RagA family TonB-linked outer membrane protein [Mucilaginibacter sp.]|uniref:SusC/RagA family TonB-linked outer membrane protein n=1 Tax=Mucilaginibacter sp. TaxID=1882438 RepID=UPI0025E79583|nr:SusC/RagA family TonB-linked outer membrane protein [Mucilaginibacter sp.]
MLKKITQRMLFFILLLCTWSTLKAQNAEITGIVKDEKGAPMVGATVVVTAKNPDQKKAMLTNEAGKFFFAGLNAQTPYLITISYVGYKTKNIDNFILKQAEQSSLIVQLESNSALNEVVVVGYGSNTKRNILQSVSTVKAKDIVEIPAATLSQGLAGRVPGLVISQSGGKPGKSSTITVRAYDGFGTAKPPLFVIDGIISDQFAFDGLDASEVENISVLKDGASAAAYGVRGANGVIVVTTKKGQNGLPKINIISSYSTDKATIQPQSLSAYDEATFTNDILKQTNPTGYLTDSRRYTDDELAYFKTTNYNILKEFYKTPTEYRTTANVSGGSEKINYFVSGSYYKGTGSFDNIDYKKYNIRANVDAKITNNLDVSLKLTTDIRNDQKPFWLYDYDNDDVPNLYQGLLTRGKMAPAYINYNGKEYPSGTLLAWNPGEVINGDNGYNRKNWSNYQALVDVNYNLSSLVDGLKLHGSFANYSRHDFRKALNLPYSLYVSNRTGGNNHIVGDQIDFTKTKIRNDGNTIGESYTASNFYQLNFSINYDKSFGKHNISATAVYEQSETKNQSFNAQNQFVLSPQLDQIGLASSDPTNYSIGGSEFDDGRLAGFGRVNYNYDGKYLLEASLRYEGSRYFIPNKRYASFPAVSAGWRISDESFFKDNIKFINDFKFKASLGFTGEEPDGGAIQWNQYYRAAAGAIFGGVTNGVAVGTYPNADITWAKKRSIDIGFDASLLNNALTVSATRYMNKRTDILGNIGANVPDTWGGIYPLVNFGAVESHGYEAAVNYRKILNDNLTISAGVNYSYAINKQLSINQASNIRSYLNQVGRPVGDFLGLVSTGIIRTQAELNALPAGYTINGAIPKLGMINYKDVRGATSDAPDGKIDGNDQQFIGNSVPRSTYGLTLGAVWKSFSIDVLVQGVGKFYKMPNLLNFAQYAVPEAGSAAFWADHWTPETPNGKYPIYADGSTSTFWLQDASFIRLKNVNLGWSIPAHLLGKSGFKQVRVFLNSSNLFFFKRNIKDYDPEAASIVAYPLNRNYTFGVNFTL